MLPWLPPCVYPVGVANSDLRRCEHKLAKISWCSLVNKQRQSGDHEPYMKLMPSNSIGFVFLGGGECVIGVILHDMYAVVENFSMQRHG